MSGLVEPRETPAVGDRSGGPRAIEQTAQLGLPPLVDAHPTERRRKGRIAIALIAGVANDLDGPRTNALERLCARLGGKRRSLLSDAPHRVGRADIQARMRTGTEHAQQCAAQRGGGEVRVAKALVAASDPTDAMLMRDFTGNGKKSRKTVGVLLTVDVRECEPALAEERDLTRPLQPVLRFAYQ